VGVNEGVIDGDEFVIIIDVFMILMSDVCEFEYG
jgi:hypothetical protein